MRRRRGFLTSSGYAEMVRLMRPEIEAGRVLRFRGRLPGALGAWRKPEYGAELLRADRGLLLRIYPKKRAWLSELYVSACTADACALVGVERVRGCDGVPVPCRMYADRGEVRVVWSDVDPAEVRKIWSACKDVPRVRSVGQSGAQPDRLGAIFERSGFARSLRRSGGAGVRGRGFPARNRRKDKP